MIVRELVILRQPYEYINNQHFTHDFFSSSLLQLHPTLPRPRPCSCFCLSASCIVQSHSANGSPEAQGPSRAREPREPPSRQAEEEGLLALFKAFREAERCGGVFSEDAVSELRLLQCSAWALSQSK